ncbi:outer membrane beta-barrel protein [Nonlabens sp. Ci31]|uniref:outer membrane beta-barrel protein n=1 Tax=Nonlabens sp. Ci31 TaxID=2608253 RepID=UPI0014636D15|nr:outer membrane beta-barrel protein [Nonlabens sp. Ci31]QJP33410.1 outer membrane beta-barrel protein [Nonlabens sp. Ci31]
MRLFLAIIFIVTSCVTVTAQQFNIIGVVKDSITNEKLQSATVYLESVKDSTLIAYSITDAEGVFTLTANTAYEKVNFITSFQGYKNYTAFINLTDGRDLDLGEIILSSDIEALNGILITARKAPITVKKDTLEFNAKSFNTRADATLEDVMKELPGVEVDKDGKITVNGKEVSRILVNGKEFFGDDPQIALKNLPKEIIDKIQVTESKTDTQKATGEAGDANASEINITIDEDKNKGWFSRLTAGGGTDERYSMSGIANYFNNDFKLSVLGSSNNINSPGFSFDEIYDAMGSSAYSISRSSNGSFGINGQNFGGSGGITSSDSAGLNVSNDWGETVSAQMNYFYGGNDTRSAADSRRETFLPDRTFITESSNRGDRLGDSHRISGRIEVKPDTLTSFNIRPNVNLSNNFSNNTSSSISSDESGAAINEVSTSSTSDSDNQSLGANFSFSRKTLEKGTYFGFYGNANTNQSDAQSDFNSTRTTFDEFSNPETPVIQDQLINNNSKSSSFSFTPYFNKKLTDALGLALNYNVETGNQENKRSIFDRDGSGDLFFNNTLSNDYEVKNTQQRPSLGLRYNKGDLRLDVYAGVIHQTLESEDILLNTSFDKEFTDPYVRANVNYKFGKYGRAYVNYSNSINVPSVRQLQPVEDRTNPQNIVIGNPDLDASQQHNIYFNLSRYDWEKGSGFYSGGGFTYTDNSVAAISTTDADLIRTTTYTNINGEYNGYLYTRFAKTWKKDAREIGVDLSLNGNLSLNKGFTNGTAFQSENYSFTPGISFEYSLQDYIDVELEYEISANRTQYDITSITEQDFVNQRVALDITTLWPEHVILGIRGEYNKFGNITGDFDDDSFVLIGSLGYKFAKDKATVKLKAYDILNQIIDTRRSITDDFVADTSSLVLQQYFMLSFTYKLSKFGGKDPNKEKGF